MTDLQFHEIAGIFALMQGHEYDALVADIQAHGVLEPIWLYEGKILDGRNRYNAAREAGATFETKTFNGSAFEAIEFAWSLNRTRRHLSPSQAAMADARRNKLTDVYAAVREAARERQGTRNDLRPNIQEQIPECDGDATEVIADKPPAPQTRDIRAKAAGTNAKYINLADKILETRPEMAAEVEAGKKTLSDVQRTLREDAREQRRDENRALIAATPAITAAAIARRFATITIDPPWDWGDEGDKDQMGRARPTYGTMALSELLELPVGDMADTDCHIYLWITNRSLPKGFQLLERWGFRYITALTWCKPSIGMGNYFRGSTEQILFGVKGSQPLRRKDVGTWFQAPRGPNGHSSKPVSFYDLVESCSPGPYLEIFARSGRDDWTSWGAESNAH